MIRIQINHEKLLTKPILAFHLFNEIGEEYNLTAEEVEVFLNIESSVLIPNQSFITIFTLTLPDLGVSVQDLQDIVKSYLNTLSVQPFVISVIKTYDSLLHRLAEAYYKDVIELEMDMRNVLTYILTYDEKSISEQLFKDFGINKSEKIDFESIRDKFENGLFYIYFNHYANFSQPEKIKADQIIELLQSPTINTFEDFKTKIQNRAIKEDRHTQFLLSIKTKLKPIEDMRNAIMHIRNLSPGVISNFDKAVIDTPDEKGAKSLINDFWINELNLLNEKTWLSMASLQIDNLITIQDAGGRRFYKMNDDFYETEFVEGYWDLDEFRAELVSYLIDRIELPQFDATRGDFEANIIDLIAQKL